MEAAEPQDICKGAEQMNSIDVKKIREKLAQALSRKFDSSKGIAVYGAGDTAERWFASFLEGDGDIVPDYFIDDTPGKQGGFLCGKPIISFEEAHALCKSFLIFPCSIVPETRRIMEKSLQDDPIEGAEFCPVFDEYVFCKHSEEILSIFDMVGDDLSKMTYANMILTRMGKAEQNQSFTLLGQNYFAITPFIKCNVQEVFVDCGAYVGDTFEQFLAVRAGLFHKIYAFEPFARNFRAMTARAERLTREWGLEDHQIELIQAGVGEKKYKTNLRVDSHVDGGSLSPESDHGDIPVISIDDFFAGQTITFLKADIEGYEWKMLHGAERVIRRDRPKLAVCIYHTPFDMYRIALWIKSVCPDYKFEIRQHNCEIWDTVLYAYI